MSPQPFGRRPKDRQREPNRPSEPRHGSVGAQGGDGEYPREDCNGGEVGGDGEHGVAQQREQNPVEQDPAVQGSQEQATAQGGTTTPRAFREALEPERERHQRDEGWDEEVEGGYATPSRAPLKRSLTFRAAIALESARDREPSVVPTNSRWRRSPPALRPHPAGNRAVDVLKREPLREPTCAASCPHRAESSRARVESAITCRPPTLCST